MSKAPRGASKDVPTGINALTELPAGEDLATPSGAHRLLRAFGLTPRKRLGQHFLTSRRDLNRIVSVADLRPTDVVLEVGAGLGTLTQALAQKAGFVVAVEKDPALIPILRAVCAPYPHVRIVRGDILSIPPNDLFRDVPSGQRKVVSNLPYYLASTLILRLLYASPQGGPFGLEPSRAKPSGPRLQEGALAIRLMVLTIQEEVARRIVAAPGTKEYGLLSVLVQYRADAQIATSVSRASFYPQPEVDSAVVRLEVHPGPPVHVVDEQFFVGVVRAAFGQRRKQLHNALAALLSVSKEAVEEACRHARIDPRRRAETLSLPEFAALSNALYTLVHETRQAQ